jgi:hypothetical protein
MVSIELEEGGLKSSCMFYFNKLANLFNTKTKKKNNFTPFHINNQGYTSVPIYVNQGHKLHQ